MYYSDDNSSIMLIYNSGMLNIDIITLNLSRHIILPLITSIRNLQRYKYIIIEVRNMISSKL